MSHSSNIILQIQDLTVDFDAGKATVHRALDGVSLSISEGEILGLVGESGSGKTVLSHSILGLLPKNGRVVAGQIVWQGQELQNLAEKQLRPIRGKEIAMIFQDPQASLNPVYPVGKQIEWVLKLHRNMVGVEAENEVVKLLENVRLLDSERVSRSYPHELSGGMCQRVMIAMALACRPKLLIADESTSALDVTTQAEIVLLLRDLVSTHGMALLFISHDLGLISHLSEKVIVLCKGRVAEAGITREVLTNSSDAYTQKLISATRLNQIPA